MRLLITGSDGFTGRHLCSEATKTGHEVVKLKANILDKESLTSEILDVKPDLIVHLAGISFVANPDKISFYNVNVIGTTNLLDAVLELPEAPFKVLISSSANVYGNCNSSSIDETMATNPINHYSASKLAMEKIALTYKNKIPIIITRPFNYTGPGQDINFVIPKIVNHFLNQKPSILLGNIKVEREFNDVKMVCDLYLKLLSIGVSGEIYNICSGKAYSLEMVIETLCDLTGHTIEVDCDHKLIRHNEVHRLRGNPQKTDKLLMSQSLTAQSFLLEQTLKSMMN